MAWRCVCLDNRDRVIWWTGWCLAGFVWFGTLLPSRALALAQTLDPRSTTRCVVEIFCRCYVQLLSPPRQLGGAHALLRSQECPSTCHASLGVAFVWMSRPSTIMLLHFCSSCSASSVRGTDGAASPQSFSASGRSVYRSVHRYSILWRYPLEALDAPYQMLCRPIAHNGHDTSECVLLVARAKLPL